MLWGIAALLLGLIALLSVPVDLVFRVQRESSLRAHFSVRWMFGLVQFPIRRRPSDKKLAKPKPKKRKKRGGIPSWLRRLSGALRKAEFRRRLLKFLAQVITAAEPRNFAVRLRLGLDDPADTGLLWAFLGPLIAVLHAFPDAHVNIGADFAGETLEIDAGGNLRFIPAQIVWISARFALSPVTLRTAWMQLARA